MAAGLIAILVFVTAVTVGRPTDEREEVTLHDATLDLSDDAIRIYSLRIPRAGTLEIEAVNSGGHRFNVYVAVANSPHRTRRPHELPLLAEFTSERAQLYRKSPPRCLVAGGRVIV